MPILWLRVALGFYSLGLLHALISLTRPSSLLTRIAVPAMSVGMVFQFVSLAETLLVSGQGAIASIRDAESLLALLVMAAFLVVYLVYRTPSPSIVVFPLVFLLTFAAATHQQPLVLTSTVRSGWLIAHIALIFAGYAALFLSFTSSLLYLVQEGRLKAKKPGTLSRLPSLQQIDEIGYRSLLLGFPFMTLGLIAGMVVAEARFGRLDFLDPKILLSILMWAVYVVMLYTRWSAGWRGRRAAYLAAGAFVAALVAWSANYFSTIHKVVQS